MRNRFTTVTFLLAGLVPASNAAAVVWPGGAPCNTSLQACIEATASAGIVDVASNDVIDETLFVNKPFTLRAAAGYSPVLAAGRVIAGTVNTPGSWTWTVQGFELRQGFISANVSGGTQATIVIERNRVRSALSGAAEISVVTSAATTLRYRISRNELDFTWPTPDGSLRAALQILDSFATPSANVTAGVIRENRIIARDNAAMGILVSTFNREHRTDIFANHVHGGRSSSIQARLGSLVSATGGSLEANVIGNVVRSVVPGMRDAQGIIFNLFDGSAIVQAVNNTVVDSQYGVDVYADAAITTLSGSIARNIFAYTLSRGLSRFGLADATTVPDNNNVFWQTGTPPAEVSATSFFVDPRFVRAPEDLRLAPTSPARDASPTAGLAALLTSLSLPAIDADGLRRFKVGRAGSGTNTLDLGAFEAGDVTFVQDVAGGANTSTINHPSLNGFSSVNPQITANWNPAGQPGVYNNHATSIGYGGGTWVLREEDLVAFPTGASFNVFVPGVGNGEYRHQPTASNIIGNETTLSQAGLDGDSTAVVIVSRDWSGTTAITDVVSPIGVRYTSGQWRVARVDGFGIPDNGGFDVYFQPPSFNAFRVTSSAGNVDGNVMLLDHSLLNGDRCAQLQVTRSTAGVANTHHIGVYYATLFQRWAIFNQDFAAMPIGVEYHVLIDPQRNACHGLLFANGFE